MRAPTQTSIADRANRDWSTLLTRRIDSVRTRRVFYFEESKCKLRIKLNVLSQLRSSSTTTTLAHFSAPCSDEPADDKPIQHPTRCHPSHALPSQRPHRVFAYRYMASRRSFRAPARHSLRTGPQNDREGLETLPAPSAQKARRGFTAKVRMHEESNAGARGN